MSGIFTRDRLVYALLFFTAVLMLFWPIPNTTAIRYGSLGALIILTLSLVNFRQLSPSLKPFVYLLLTFIIWVLAVALFFSLETQWTLKESQIWFFALASFGVGIMLGNIADRSRLFVTLICVIFIHIVYLDLNGIRSFVEHGVLTLRLTGLSKGPHDANYITNFGFAILVTEIFFRVFIKKRIIPVDNFILFLMLAMTALSSYFEAMRFGFLGLVAMLATLLMLWFAMQKGFNIRRVSIAAFATLLFAILTLFISFKSDSRWNTLAETIPIALDTKTYKAWLNWNKYQRPILSDGEEVNHSNYIRIARAKEGIEFILQNPFGIGYGRHAFGHAMMYKYGESCSFTESGIIDLGIGVGLPGVAFWVIFVFSLGYYGVRSFYRDRSYYGLVLFFIAGGYFFRMMFDSIIKDHMLEQFMFLAGLFLALTIQEKNEKNSASEV